MQVVISVEELTVILHNFTLCVVNEILAPSLSDIIPTKSHFA